MGEGGGWHISMHININNALILDFYFFIKSTLSTFTSSEQFYCCIIFITSFLFDLTNDAKKNSLIKVYDMGMI